MIFTEKLVMLTSMKQLHHLPNAYLHESIKNIDRLSERVRIFLQIDSKKHILHVLQKRQEIIIIVEEPILASQLKYQQKAILTDLNQSLLGEYKTIKIKLSPPKMAKKVKTKNPRPLPEDISKLLNQVRKELGTDE